MTNPLAALVGLAAIFSSCSVKEDLAVCEKSEAKSEVYLDLLGFGSLSFELSPEAYTFVAVAHDVALTAPSVPR